MARKGQVTKMVARCGVEEGLRTHIDLERHEVEYIHDYEIALSRPNQSLIIHFSIAELHIFPFLIVLPLLHTQCLQSRPSLYFLCSKCAQSDRRGSATNPLDGRAQLRHGHVDQSSTPDVTWQLARFRQLASQLPSIVPSPCSAIGILTDPEEAVVVFEALFESVPARI